MIQLQAHRGVSTEYPENTMAAFRGAICQEYSIIELDPAVTADGVFVVLHDAEINRTARRPDGSVIGECKRITEITYEEADSYEYGSWFSPKFKGEKLPLLKDVLQLAKENDILIKIDSKIWGFSEKYMESFWKLLGESGAPLAITCNSIETVESALQHMPDIRIHYDGRVEEEILQKLQQMTDKLTVWLNIPFASDKLCRLVKKYAALGIRLVSEYADYDRVCAQFEPDIVETPGQIKPLKNIGKLVDHHTHSENSHDSSCRIKDMAEAQQKKGIFAFGVTDHCDIRDCDLEELAANIRNSTAQAVALREYMQSSGECGIEILTGVEMGGSMNHPALAEYVRNMFDYDVIISALHEVLYIPGDISSMPEEDLYTCLGMYYDNYLRNLQAAPCDIAAHIHYPLRYINGVYGRNIDCRRFEEKVRRILQYEIRHGIALEINTSCMYPDGRDLMEQDWILKLYAEMGGYLITLGSDAHCVENAAREFDRAAALLKKHGFRNCFYYKNRQSIQCTIV